VGGGALLAEPGVVAVVIAVAVVLELVTNGGGPLVTVTGMTCGGSSCSLRRQKRAACGLIKVVVMMITDFRFIFLHKTHKG